MVKKLKLKDEEMRGILNNLDFKNGVIVLLDNEQVLKLQIQEVYIDHTQYIKRFAKLVKKGTYVRKYSTMFPKSNDCKTDDKVLNLKIMFKLAQLKNVEEIDFEII